MPVVIIERVHHAWTEMMGSSCADFDHLAFAGYAVVRLEMVRVLELQFGVRCKFCEMQGKVDTIVAAKEAPASPSSTTNVSISSGEVSQASYDHCAPSSIKSPFKTQYGNCINE